MLPVNPQVHSEDTSLEQRQLVQLDSEEILNFIEIAKNTFYNKAKEVKAKAVSFLVWVERDSTVLMGLKNLLIVKPFWLLTLPRIISPPII